MNKSLVVFVGTIIFLLPGLLQLEVDSDASKALLPAMGMEAKMIGNYESEFPSNSGAVLYVEVPDVVTQKFWETLQALTNQLEELEGVSRVDSLANAKIAYERTRDGEVEVVLGDLIEHDTALDNALLKQALEYKSYRNVFLFEDVSILYTAVYIIPETEGFDAFLFSTSMEAVVEQYDLNVLHAGEPIVSTELSRILARAFWPILGVIILIFLLVWFDTSRWSLGFLAVVNGVMGLLFAWSAMGYLGTPRNPFNELVVNMIIPLGAGFLIHAVGYKKQNHGYLYSQLLQKSFGAFSFAALTTAIGYGATGISIYPAIQQFGLYGLIGIGGCLLTTFFIVMPALAKMDIPNRPSRIMALLGKVFVFTRPVIISRRSVTAVFLGSVVFIIIGERMVVMDYAPAEYLKASNPIRQDIDAVRKFGPVYSIPLVIEGNLPEENEEWGNVIDPEVSQRVDAFCRQVESERPGLRALGITETLSELWLLLSDGEQTYPQDRSGVVQLLTFFVSDEKDRELFLSDHKMVYLLQVPFVGSAEFAKLDKEVMQFSTELEKEYGVNAYLTGNVAGYFRAGNSIAHSNWTSFWWASLIIYGVFLVLMRNVITGFIGMMVNVVPVLFMYSLMGVLGINLDIGTSIILMIALALVCDDTGHLLFDYKENKQAGLSPRAAIDLAVRDRWEQVALTTVVISLGFSCMLLAELIPMQTFAILLSLTMGTALFGDLVLLPGCLAHFDISWQDVRRRLKHN